MNQGEEYQPNTKARKFFSFLDKRWEYAKNRYVQTSVAIGHFIEK